MHLLNDLNSEVVSFLVVFPIGTVEDSTYFVKADVAQGNSGTAVLEEVVNVAIF